MTGKLTEKDTRSTLLTKLTSNVYYSDILLAANFFQL